MFLTFVRSKREFSGGVPSQMSRGASDLAAKPQRQRNQRLEWSRRGQIGLDDGVGCDESAISAITYVFRTRFHCMGTRFLSESEFSKGFACGLASEVVGDVRKGWPAL